MRHTHIHNLLNDTVFNMETHPRKTTKALFICHEKYMVPLVFSLSYTLFLDILLLSIHTSLSSHSLWSQLSEAFSPSLYCGSAHSLDQLTLLYNSITLRLYTHTRTIETVKTHTGCIPNRGIICLTCT